MARKSAKRESIEASPQRTKAETKLLTGGNPQIPKGDGNAPVQAYIRAMPGWKSAMGGKIDRLIVEHAPGVQKAVRWNTPFYGIEGNGWFMAYSCCTRYIKVNFFNGSSLDPLPPVESKHKDVRYFHIFENQVLDEQQFVDWIKQSANLPGEDCF
ncbi:MAG: DUF1801 domain-containing protein [Phycisphaera sp.]|nr:MAG: DUF1801 domain-containing protein [Phycisphaera sp.]